MANKKITLEDFIQKSVEKQEKMKKFIDIEVKEMDGTVTFKRPSDDTLLKYMSVASNAVETDENDKVIKQDLEMLMSISKEIIYESCEYLKNQELQEKLEVIDPLDIVIKVFGIDKTLEIAATIIEKFMDKDIGKKVKN